MELEEILIIARNADGKVHWADGVSDTGIKFSNDSLVAFANAIAAHEREECAKLCEERSKGWAEDPVDGTEVEMSWKEDEAKYCAEAIRARGNK